MVPEQAGKHSGKSRQSELHCPFPKVVDGDRRFLCKPTVSEQTNAFYKTLAILSEPFLRVCVFLLLRRY